LSNFLEVSVHTFRFHSRTRIAVLVLTLGLACLLPASAQQYLGTLSGDVEDSSGARVAGAQVVASNAATKFETKAVTNGTGEYVLPSLNPGTYTVTISAGGFRTETRTDVELTAGANVQTHFTLQPGTTRQDVVVTAETQLLDTSSANIATTLSTREVTDLPNIGRNPYVMATLAAGVINTGSGGYFQGKASSVTNPFSGVAVQITSDGNGGHNRLLLDGIPNDAPERLSGATYTNFVPSPEAVQEVKVQSSIFDAQVGHGNGTVTNTIIRSGANTVHGAAYYVFQNTYLNANTAERSLNKLGRGNDQLSQTGFVLDGPVLLPKVYDGRDKTFFMVAYERFASHASQPYSTRVPNTAERGGDFSGLCSTFNSSGLCTSGIQLYDPNSPVDASGNRTVFFANNVIPSSRLTTAGAAILSYFPTPNVSGAAISPGAVNYISSQTTYSSTYPSFVVRFDQAFGQKNKLNAIFFRSSLTQSNPTQGFPKEVGPSGCVAPGNCDYHVYRNNRGGSLDDVHQFSPSMVLDSRIGVVFHPFGLVYPDNQNFDLSKIGISSNGLPYTSFPAISMSGYASLAGGASGQISTSTVSSLNEILTKTIGSHTVRIGFEGNLMRYNVQNPQSGLGTINFDNRFTQKNYQTGDSTSGDAMASLLLGSFSAISYNISPAYALQQLYLAPFIQDDWRATRRLTLNLGFRWDYESPFTERYNKQVLNFCTTCTSPLQSSVTGLPLKGGLQFTGPGNRYPYPKDLNNFQPRLGIAYQASEKTVIRAGFGVIYFNTTEGPIGTGFSQTTSYNNFTTNTPLNPLTAPFPGGVLLPTGSSLGLATSIGGGVSFYDPNHVQPKSTQYSASVQQQFPGNWTLQLAYVGARPTRLEVNHNIDILPAKYYNCAVADPTCGLTFLNSKVANPMAGQIPQNSGLNASTIAESTLLLPYPQFSSVTENGSSIGTAPYNALQIQVAKPMRHHFNLQGNLTWDKVMLHTAYLDNYWAAVGKLESIQDPNPTLFANIFGSVELPRLLTAPAYERLALGGWQLNGVARFSNGNLIGAPGNVDIIGNYYTGNWSLRHQFNTCWQQPTTTSTSVTWSNVVTAVNSSTGLVTNQACDTSTSAAAFRQRIGFTSQTNSPYLNLRIPLKPLMDLSVFKKFTIHESTSFEIRGEFYNVLNTPEWGGPSTSLGAANFGSAATAPQTAFPNGFFNQANDARIGQLTARINF
jgi:hypothetical protein